MADYPDYFKTPPKPTEDLRRLPDSAQMRLRDVTVGEFKEFVRENSLAVDDIDDKAIINRMYARKSVTTDILADRAVTFDKLSAGAVDVSALPSGAQTGDITTFTPTSGVVWLLVAGGVVGGARRWFNLSAGTPIRAVFAGDVNFTTSATPGTRTTVWFAVVTPWAGGYRFEFESSIRLTSAGTPANTGKLYVSNLSVAADLSSGANYGRSVQWESSSTATATGVVNLASAVNVGITQTNNAPSTTFQLHSPEMRMFLHYLDGPL